MTDQEITRLCAEVMADDQDWASACEILRVAELVAKTQPVWARHLIRAGKNAKAMALVKKLRLDISHCDPSGWMVFSGDGDGIDAFNECLNRAICECVASMQSKVSAPTP